MATLWESVGQLFGFQIERPEEKVEEIVKPSFAPKENDDGAVTIAATGGFYGTFVDLEGTVRNEAELVNRYRDMTLHPEVDSAIEDIIDEAIVTEDGEKTVQIVLDNLPGLPPAIKKAIENEFENVLKLLEFNTKSYDVFRRWYVDGRLYYHAIINPESPQDGISELRYIDPRKIRKVRETTKVKDRKVPAVQIEKVVKEYYMYSEKELTGNQQGGFQNPTASQGIRIAKDSIIHCTSGVTDTNGKMVVGFLHKAIKPLNQLRALEDATIIYRISRAPERRVFYIDVGNLPKMKAEQYIRDMMTKHRNKLVYDSVTGEIKDDRKFMTMLEDYWLPRREGGRGTEIDTLQGGTNLGKMEDVEYFQKKLYKSLNVPADRLDDSSVFDIGRSTQITRSEVKFAKFIDRLRLRFSSLFLKVLEKQLILKGVISPEDWDAIQSDIGFRFLRDNDFSELKDQEILAGRMNVLTLMTPFIGRFWSNTWVRKNILKQDEQEMETIDAEIAKEMTMAQYMPTVDSMGGPLDQPTLQEDNVPDEPTLEELTDLKLKESLINLLENEKDET